MTGPRLLVRTPGRLHFGLLGWGPGSRRQFGGLGLMIDSPGIELTVERATTQVVEGPLSDRVARILEVVRERIAEPGIFARPVAIRILQAPPEHVGLGVGTQLSLAIATAVLRLAGYPDPSAEQLALLTGRGHRSGIGLHGFRHGGFLVNGGRREEGSVPPLLTRHHFPDEWSVLVVQPPGRHGLHGRDELRAFSELPPIAESLTDRLCRLVMLGILPAIVERDLAAFGAAIEELQAHVGASFARRRAARTARPGRPRSSASSTRPDSRDADRAPGDRRSTPSRIDLAARCRDRRSGFAAGSAWTTAPPSSPMLPTTALRSSRLDSSVRYQDRSAARRSSRSIRTAPVVRSLMA